ncbi:MAG: endopeptidase La [Bacilli bacterium]
MKKYNLPVILLKGLILLPYNTIKLEYDDNNVIDMAQLFHDDYILISYPTIKTIGVLAKITNKIELPNGNIRVDITGLRQINIIEYMNLNEKNEPLESIVCEIEHNDIDNEKIIIDKLLKEIKLYVKNIPYMSNSFLPALEEITTLDKFINIAVPNLSLTYDKTLEYLKTSNTNLKAEMLLKDIYQNTNMFEIEHNLDMKVKRYMDEEQKEYILKQKMKFIKEELGEQNENSILKKRIDVLNCNPLIKDKLNYEYNRYVNSNSSDTSLIRDYLEWLLTLPWNILTEDNHNLKQVKEELDKSHYGLEEVKQRIIEYLAVISVTKSLKGPIICLVGPPGTGKTSLAFSIASAIHKNFVKLSLGGVSDEAYIIGHRRTYIGATPGRIISSMVKAKSSNPLFLIDEIDKLNSDYKGDPASSLLSVLDYEQNKYFSDNYIEEEFDLSKVMFILTANNIDDIPYALKDRLEIIELSGYTTLEKLDIAKKYLIPKICKANGLNHQYLIIDDNVILTIINNYTKEAGVRELDRQLNKIVRKIVTQMVVNHISINKIIITNKLLIQYLGKNKYPSFKLKDEVGIVNALAYTTSLGTTLPIEVTYYKGHGSLILTGSLGSVIQESANIALSYIKANYQTLKIDYSKFNNDIHINVPNIAVKKEGPSAGIALTLAIISALTNKKISSSIALTGEITLRGNILPIGGLKEKSIGALRDGINKIIIPFDNNTDDIPKEIKDKITFIPVKTFDDVLKEIDFF